MEDLDRSTGAVLAALERLGLDENTLVLITSDNGADYNGSPGALRGRKGEVLEGGQRVPMIARWPGTIEPGRVSDEMAMNIDIFPTLLAMAGVALPEDRVIDGADLTAFLRGSPNTPTSSSSTSLSPPRSRRPRGTPTSSTCAQPVTPDATSPA